MVLIQKLMNCPMTVFGAIIGVSVIALAGALTGQFAFDLPPCNLCIWQRLPFVLVIVWGSAGLFWKAGRVFMLGMSAATFLGNSVLALYHSGVEREWWQEAVGCAAHFNLDNGPQDLLSQITSAQTSSCAQIAWADPVLGLSMANYNVALCLGMAVFCLIGLGYQIQQTDDSERDSSVE